MRVSMSLGLALAEGILMFVAGWIGFGHRSSELSLLDYGLVAGEAFAFAMCGLFAFHFNDLYDLKSTRRFRTFLGRLGGALLMTACLAAVLHLASSPSAALAPVVESVCLGGLLVLPLRALIHHLSFAHPFTRRILVLGTTDLAAQIVDELFLEPNVQDTQVGVVDDRSSGFEPLLPAVRLGVLDDLAQIIHGFKPDLIVCATGEGHDSVLARELLKPRAQGIPVEDGVSAYERLTGKIAIEHASPRSVLLSHDNAPSALGLLAARSLSFLTALAGLLLCAPFFIPIALLIKLDSEGPVFFVHPRIGKGGRSFGLIKFRTMRTDGAVSEWAADNRHRTTRVGAWLRRFRIDELPQFVNILKGDMNLVGPRPHPVSNLELFTQNIPYYGVRCSVRPGVTGWAQIRYGYANNLQEETEKMRYDLHYIKHFSFALDVRILFETLKVIASGSRSAALEGVRGRSAPIYFGPSRPRIAPRPLPFTRRPDFSAEPSEKRSPVEATLARSDSPIVSARATSQDVA